MIPGASTLNKSDHPITLRHFRELGVLYAIASLGVLINMIYVLLELFRDEPFANFSRHMSANIFIWSLIIVFPLVAYFIFRYITRSELVSMSRLLEIEVATRTRQLEDLKDFTENVMASVNDLIFVIGSDGRFHFVRGNYGMLGCELEQLGGYQFIDLVAPGSVAEAVGSFERVLRGEDVSPYEIEIIACDNERKFLEISSTGYREDNVVIAQVGVARDVTERRKLEQHVLKRNRELSSLNSVATAVGKTLELKEVLSAALDRIAALLNSDRAWVHLYSPEDDRLELSVWKGRKGPVAAMLATVRPGVGLIGKAAEGERPVAANVEDYPDFAGARVDGPGFASLAAAPMRCSQKLFGVLSVASDKPDCYTPEGLDLLNLASTQVAMAVENALLFEQSRKMTGELADQNRELEEATEEISQLICSAEREQSFSVRYENPGLIKCWEVKECGQTGCPSYEAENLRCWQVAGTHCGGKVQGMFAQKIGNCEKCEVYQMVRTDRLAGLGEAFNNMMAILERRVEEQRRLQEQLVHSTKLAVIGELAANVAHEINNPLTGVLGYSSLLLRNMEPDEPGAKNLRVIEKETLRARDIVRNLLDFSRQETGVKEECRVAEVVADTLSLLRKQAELAGVEVVDEYADELPPVFADANQLKQVFINILNNAIFAMPEGGRLTVKVRAVRPIGDRGNVEISFRDTGIGIPADRLEHVFEPFYTSKNKGEGTGLGLSVSRRIIEEHGGSIEVNSMAGAGATFTVKLPVVSAEENSEGRQRVA